MEPLEAFSACSASTAGLVRPLLRASHRHHGLLLLSLDEVDGCDDLAFLIEQPAGKQGSQAVAPHTVPAGASALHRLGRKLTKAHMLRLGEHPYRLHAHLDNLEDWLQPTSSSAARVHSGILVSTTTHLDEHIDRGLFNIVVCTPGDLAGLQLHIRGERVPVQNLLPEDIDDEGLLALVIPGYTLQCIDPGTPAVPHSGAIRLAHGLSGCSLQWRLHPGYAINGASVAELMAKFDSAQAEAAAEAHRRRVAEYEALRPALPGLESYRLHVTDLSGHTTVILANPDWKVENLKWAVMQQMQDVLVDDQRLIYEGKQLADGQTLQSCSMTHDCTLHMVRRLKGD
ncbi:hypothetical protein ABPG75_007571 [Micractinium tetrahymenae]